MTEATLDIRHPNPTAGQTRTRGRPFRLAWIGEAGSGGGVPGLCRLFLLSLADSGIELDWYCRGSIESVPELAHIQTASRVRVFPFPFPWNWDSWYGRNPKVAFLVGFQRRIAAFQRLAAELVRHHRERPYDAVLQFSQAELFALRRHTPELPIILFPCVHAAGELRWCRAEEPLARQCEPWWWRRFRLLQLALRDRIQKRDYNAATGIIGLSKRFNELVARDYMLDTNRMGVVYHPIETGMMRADRRVSRDTIRLLFVGRISVRKGVEVLVESIPRLLAADTELEVTIIGEGAQWSNYEPLLNGLPVDRCTWRKGLSNSSVIAEMEQSDILLVPSSYEPGGIVVGEALACGMVIAASDEVGSAENLPSDVRWRYPARNTDAFVKAVSDAASAVRNQGIQLRSRARQIAEDQFSPDKAAASLLSQIQRLVESHQL